MIKDKLFFTYRLILISFILSLFFNPVIYADVLDVNDFSLYDYKEKAVVDDSHILYIENKGLEVITLKDVDYLVVGDEYNVTNFNRCVDIKVTIDNKIIKFTGDVKEWGVYSVDIQPIIKGNNLDGVNNIGSWWNSAWDYFKYADVCDYVEDFQVRVVVGYEEGEGDVDCDQKCDEDFEDIRFIGDDNITVLDYWVEDNTVDTEDEAVFWVNIQDFNKVLLYFGNDDAVSISNGTKTFIFFDDFEDSNINTTKWDEQTSNAGETEATETGGDMVLERDQDNLAWEGISMRGKTYIPSSNIIQTSMKWTVNSFTQTGYGLCNKSSGYIKDIIDPGDEDDAMIQYYYDRLTEQRFYSQSSDGDGNKNDNYDSQFADSQASYIFMKMKHDNGTDLKFYTGTDSDPSTLEDTYVTLIPDDGMYPVLILRGRPYTDDAIAYFDWVFVRKFAVTESTFCNWSDEYEQPICECTIEVVNIVNGTMDYDSDLGYVNLSSFVNSSCYSSIDYVNISIGTNSSNSTTEPEGLFWANFTINLTCNTNYTWNIFTSCNSTKNHSTFWFWTLDDCAGVSDCSACFNDTNFTIDLGVWLVNNGYIKEDSEMQIEILSTQFLIIAIIVLSAIFMIMGERTEKKEPLMRGVYFLFVSIIGIFGGVAITQTIDWYIGFIFITIGGFWFFRFGLNISKIRKGNKDQMS